jgi:predicted nucleotidyltransferase/uncharacterized protein with HEPN domain
MRDQRRRTEIRLLVLREDAEAIDAIVREGRRAFFRPEGEMARDATARRIDHFAYFSDLPKEFRDANPAVPWERLRRLRSRPAWPYLTSLTHPRTTARLWRIASIEIPAVARRLSRPRMPRVWRNEPRGNLGINEVLGPYRTKIRRLLRKHGVRRLRVYGSVARAEADGRSDVDLLVDWSKPRGRNCTMQLASDLEMVVRRHVQVFTEEGTYWAVRDRVLSEAIEFA